MKNIPQVGEFYWHMKHNPKDLFSYLYIVVGVSLDTEEGNEEVVYAPLYETDHQLFNRDLELFMGTKMVDGESVSRFTQVKDNRLIQQIYDSRRITKWTSLLDR